MVNFPKQQPYRSKELFKFVHTYMKPAPCSVCTEKPWVQLHHFGGDGGTGMKPSDHEIARVCDDCHQCWGFKSKALIRQENYDILARMQADALVICRAWIEHLENANKRQKVPVRCATCDSFRSGGCCATMPHVEPPADCALEELNLWLVSEMPGLAPEEQRDWLLRWSNRRSANVIEFLLEPMQQFAGWKVKEPRTGFIKSKGQLIEELTHGIRFVAQQALKTVSANTEEDEEPERG